jgi:uncharacterized coiled-coil DUF342 family protein
LRSELPRRLDVLELAVRQNSGDIRNLQAQTAEMPGEIDGIHKDIREIRGEIGEMHEDIRKNTEGIRGLREALERKADHEALLKLQARVAVLEQRLGIQ